MNDIKVFDIFEEVDGHRHSICVGEHSAYCMDCGQILIEYKHKKDFKKLMDGSLFGIKKHD